MGTKKDGKPALVPKLRFPEFWGAAAWENKRLGDLFSDRQESGLTGLPLLSLMDKEGIVPQEDSNRKNNSNSDKSKYLRVVPGDIAYNTMRMWEGRSALVGLEGLVSPAYTVCEPQPGVHSLLFSYYFKTPQLIEQFRRFSQGLVKDTLNLKYPAFAQISAPVPTYPEQQKIADCLSSVDEVIAAQARKVDALKTHKKWLMQQIFPREGEAKPRLRFPEFQNDGEWEETELGKRISIKGRIGYRGYTVADIVNEGDGAISLSPSNISDSGALSFEKATYITWAKYHESPEIMVEKGHTLLVKTGSTYGKAAFVWDLPQECTVNPQIVVLKPHSIHPYFLFLLVFGDVIQRKIRAIVVGGAIPTLSQEGVSKFKIRIPAPPEQQRIATCLGSLDALITAETQKLEAIKTHKKGLMQQLFPSPEDIA